MAACFGSTVIDLSKSHMDEGSLNWNKLSDDNSETVIETDSDEVAAELKNPFVDIKSFIADSIPQESLYHVNFLLRSAYLDPFFRENRETKSIPPEIWRPEELALVDYISSFPGLNPIPPSVLSIVCAVTGRASNCLPSHAAIPKECNVTVPSTGRPPHPQQGPCLLTPTLVMREFYQKVQLPHTKWTINQTNAQEIETTDTSEVARQINAQIPKPPILSFHNAFLENASVTKFPCADGTFWSRITCGPFSIAFGNDISNGISRKNKFSWINKVNGRCPPTLSDKGSPSVKWIDCNVFQDGGVEREMVDVDLNASAKKWCPVAQKENYKALFKEYLLGLTPELRDYNFVWADPQSHTLKDSFTEDGKQILVECATFCQCGGKCDYCLLSKGSKNNLILTYSEEKGWGVIATEDIEEGSLIAEYCGLVEDHHLDSEKLSYGSYYFAIEFDDYEFSLGINSENHTNIGRFFNTGCKFLTPNDQFFLPNATPLNVISSACEKTRIGIFAKRKIYAGEEIIMSYGGAYQMARCRCHKCIRDEDKGATRTEL